jgi:hypothetical protein
LDGSDDEDEDGDEPLLVAQPAMVPTSLSISKVSFDQRGPSGGIPYIFRDR